MIAMEWGTNMQLAYSLKPAQSATVALVLAALSSVSFAQDALESERLEKDGAKMSDSVELEPVVVTATRVEKPMLEVPASLTLQDVDSLREKGFVYGTDEFRGVPGVFFRRGEGDGEEFPFITIRGVTGNHGNDTFLALVDGIPYVGPDEEVLLTEVPYAVVDTVEIVRGPVSALYGRGAIAGAVNYLTKSVSEDSSSAELSVGSEDYLRGSAQYQRAFADGGGLLLSAAREDFGGWRENSERESTSLFAKVNLPLGEAGELTGWLTSFQRDAEVPSVIPTLGDGSIVDVRGGDEAFLGYRPTRNDNDGLILAGRYQQQLGEALELAVTAQARSFESDVRLNFYDYFEFDPDNNIMGVNGFASENEADVLFLEAAMTWRAGRHTLVAGISGERTSLDESDRWSGENDPFFSGDCGFRFYAILIDYSTGQVVNDDPNNPCFVRDELRTVAKTTNTFFGAFVQDEIALSERVTATVGLRYDQFERDVDFAVVGSQPVEQRASGDANALSPKLSLSYKLGDGILYTSYGRGFNSNFGPVFQWEPDRYARDEKPTTIDSYELGWKGRSADRRIEWETAVFWLEQQDRRIFVANPDAEGPPTLATTGQEYTSRGFEGSLRLRPGARTQATFTYTYLDPEWEELIIAGSFGAPDEDFSGKTPQGVPEHMFYVGLSHAFSEHLRIGLDYERYDDYFVDLSNSVSAGGYQLLGAHAHYRFPGRSGLSLNLSVTNLLDESYYYYFAGSRTMATNVSPGVPRLARLTLKWEY